MSTVRGLQEYLRLPWTITAERRDDDGGYLVLKVEELPGFSVAEGDYDLELEFWRALENHLESYLEAGKIPPVPEGYEGRLESEGDHDEEADSEPRNDSAVESVGLPPSATSRHALRGLLGA